MSNEGWRMGSGKVCEPRLKLVERHCASGFPHVSVLSTRLLASAHFYLLTLINLLH